MDRTGITISIIATLISSIALAGVAIGLFLQTRQLAIAHRQALRTSHAELIKLGVAYADEWVDPSDPPLLTDPVSFRRAALLNWQTNHLQLTYVTRKLSDEGLRDNFDRLFVSQFRRDWWALARRGFLADSTSRRDAKFIAIADEQHRKAMRRLSAAAKTSEPRTP
jgi:hypothetical protein